MISTRRHYWPTGRVRDEEWVLLGLSIRDGWFPMALIVLLLAAPFLRG
jgi:hypothetical protein